MNEKFGFADIHGKIWIPMIYDDADLFSEGLAAVAKKNKKGEKKWGYIDCLGRVVIDFQFNVSKVHGFDLISPRFSNGLAYVDGGYINKRGEFVIRFVHAKQDCK